GVTPDNILDFYEEVSRLRHIKIIGIGSNLGCMYGVEPTYDKLLQLAQYKEQLFKKFNTGLQLISGGTSITLPLTQKGKVPSQINHFRVGEAAFFGTSPLDNKAFLN